MSFSETKINRKPLYLNFKHDSLGINLYSDPECTKPACSEDFTTCEDLAGLVWCDYNYPPSVEDDMAINKVVGARRMLASQSPWGYSNPGVIEQYGDEMIVLIYYRADSGSFYEVIHSREYNEKRLNN